MNGHELDFGKLADDDDERQPTAEELARIDADLEAEREIEKQNAANRKRVAVPSALEFFRGDEVELARALVNDLTARGPTTCTEGDVYTYDSVRGIFRPMTDAQLSVQVQEYAGTIVRDEDGPKPLKMRASHVAGTIKLARAQVTDPEFFDGAPSGLTFRNGFVTVTKEGIRLLPHSPDNRARAGYPFDYEDRPSVAWLRFLDELFANDADRLEKIALLGEFFGACLLGVAPRFGQCIVSRADGGAGRSTLLEIVRAAFPPRTCTAIPPQKLSGDGNSPDYHRAALVPALLNAVSELPESEIVASEGFKALVTGDWVTARQPSGKAFQYKPRAGHFFAANKLPPVQDQSEGFWRRWLVLPFSRRFHREGADLGIAQRIIADDLPAVVAWLLSHARKLLQQGAYTIPASHDAELATWRGNADVVALFLADATEDVPPRQRGTPASTFYEEFARWCLANGHRRVLASNSFGARMAALGYPPARDSKGKHYPRRRIVQGSCSEVLDPRTQEN